ncbi:MAG: phosphatase PAP2 family protein [Actinomycetota bacterium]|nr:phosphatase PAP2 family protein [Actinomycetota bacterium]
MINLVALVLGLVLFSWLHDQAGTNVASATANARVVQSVERFLHLNCEVVANHWLAGHPALMLAAALYYRLYYLPVAGVLLWVLVRRPDLYPKIRSTLAVMAALALLVFWFVPVSPPRFALPGIIDVVAKYDILDIRGSHALVSGHGQLSAMPSLHLGWSALGAYAAWCSLRGTHRRLAPLVWSFPLVMIMVVITTGAHYILDLVGSMVLLVTSLTAATVWNRWRSHNRFQNQSHSGHS